MKKLILLAVVTGILTANVNANNNPSTANNRTGFFSRHRSVSKKDRKGEKKELRKLRDNEVSAAAIDRFARDFERVTNVTWERTSNFDEASFIQDGHLYTAYYDDDAILVGTTTSKAFSDLPGQAQAVINGDYKSYSVMDVFMFDDNEYNQSDMSLYDKQFDDVDSYFVEMKKGNKTIVLHVSMDGDVSVFTRLK